MKSFVISAVVFTALFALVTSSGQSKTAIINDLIQRIRDNTGSPRTTVCQPDRIPQDIRAIACNLKLSDTQVINQLTTLLNTLAATTRPIAPVTTRPPVVTSRLPTAAPLSDALRLANSLQQQGEEARKAFCACSTDCKINLPGPDTKQLVCDISHSLDTVIQQLRLLETTTHAPDVNVTIRIQSFQSIAIHKKPICGVCFKVPVDGSDNLDVGCPNSITHLPLSCGNSPDLPKVAHIFFQENSKIATISNDAFTQFPNLKTVSFVNGSVSCIAQNAFSHLANLETLVLSGNKLTSFNPSVLKGNTKLTVLALDGNKNLKCSCDVDHSLGFEINVVMGTCTVNDTVKSAKGEFFGCHRRISGGSSARSSSSSTNTGLIAGGVSVFLVAVVVVIAIKRRQIRELPKRFQTMNSFSHGSSELYDQDQSFKSEKMENAYANV